MTPDTIHWNRHDLVGALRYGFHAFESRDEIVRFVHISPRIMKDLVLAAPDEIIFDFIPEGVGMIRTACLKFMPSLSDNEIRFYNEDKTDVLKIILKTEKELL